MIDVRLCRRTINQRVGRIIRLFRFGVKNEFVPATTHGVGDPRWRGPEGASLRFRVHVRSARTVRVIMHEREFANGWAISTFMLIATSRP